LPLLKFQPSYNFTPVVCQKGSNASVLNQAPDCEDIWRRWRI